MGSWFKSATNLFYKTEKESVKEIKNELKSIKEFDSFDMITSNELYDFDKTELLTELLDLDTMNNFKIVSNDEVVSINNINKEKIVDKIVNNETKTISKVDSVISDNFKFLSVNLAYKVGDKKFENRKEETEAQLIGSGWKIIAHSGENTETAVNKFKSVAFYNEATKQVHFATAGTNPNLNDVYDDLLLSFQQVPTKINQIDLFVNKVLAQLGEEANTLTFSSVGHSLGGPLSTILAAKLVSKGLEVTDLTTYDSAGSRPIVQKAIDEGYIPTINIVEFDKICYNEMTKPNFVNTLNDHNGKMILVLENKQGHDTQNSYTGQAVNKMFEGFAVGVQKFCGVFGKAPSWDLATRLENIKENAENTALHGMKNFNPNNGLVKIPLEKAGHGQQIIDSSEAEILKVLPKQSDVKHPLALIEMNEDTDYIHVDLSTYTYDQAVNAYNDHTFGKMDIYGDVIGFNDISEIS